MAAKYIKGIACAEEKAKQVIHKYEKRQPLSDIEQQYNFKQLRPMLSVPIDSDDCAPTDAPAVDLISHHGLASDDAHCSPSPSFRSQRRSLSQSPAVRKKLHTWVKPPLMDSTTDADLAEAQQQFKSVSRLVERHRKDENRALNPQDTLLAAGRSKVVAPHWVPFGSGSANVVDAFTSRPKSADRSGPRYEIETSVGKVVAAKLAQAGSSNGSLGVRVGRNGYAVKPEPGAAAAAAAASSGYAEAENCGSHPQALASLLMAQPQPLSLDDAARTCHVILTRRVQPVAETVVTSETRPVVFSEAAESRPYLPFSIRTDSGAFKQQLAQLKAVQLQDPAATIMCLCKPNDVNLDATYEEVLSIRAPTSSAMSTERIQLSVESPAPPDNPPATAATAHFGKDSSLALPVPASLTPGTNVAMLRDEFRRCMKRQVTMPSYTIVRDVDVHGRHQHPDGAGRNLKHRSQPGKSPRPPHSSMAFHKAFGPTTPTITPNGVQGRKQYVTITTDMWAYHPQDSRLGQAALSAPPVHASASSVSSGHALHVHTPGNSASNHSMTAAAAAAAGATSSGSDVAAAHSSLASSLLAGRSAASGGSSSRHSYRTSQESSRDSRSALTDRLHASRLSSTCDEEGADVGPPTWRRDVSIPTAGVPSEASDEDDGSLDGRLASATVAAAAAAAATPTAVGSAARSRSGAGAASGQRQAAVVVEARVDRKAAGPAAAAAAAAAAEGGEADTARPPPAWRGGAEELQAMRSFIQDDLARTKIETQRMIQNVNDAKKQRSTSGHVLAQEWLS